MNQQPIKSPDVIAWNTAITFTLAWEGGKSNHPADFGGRTNFGITQTSWSSYQKARPHLPADVYAITRDQAIEFYRLVFWQPTIKIFSGDELTAVAFFDTAVMSGFFGATRLMQIGLGTVDDGQIGPITMSRITSCTDYARARLICMARSWWRLENTRRTPSQRAFLVGWQNRDIALNSLIDRLMFE